MAKLDKKGKEFIESLIIILVVILFISVVICNVEVCKPIQPVTKVIAAFDGILLLGALLATLLTKLEDEKSLF